MKIQYTERETKLIVAWTMITAATILMAKWSVSRMTYPRPAMIIDLLFPMILAICGIYILKRKIEGV